MVNYRRDYTNGAIYFFTVTLQNRQSSDLTRYIDLLGDAFRHVRARFSFTTHAIAVLPDHLHAIWELPEEDYDYSLRWRLIKTRFTQARGKQNVWQKRFWEHRIRNEQDLHRHIDYIHYNPVKHGHVLNPTDWPYSSIHRYIKQNILPEHWAKNVPDLNHPD